MHSPTGHAPPHSSANITSSPSPFAQHLSTNYVPTQPEIASIQSLIDHRKPVVDEIDEEIAELQRRRRELVEKKQGHNQYIDKHHELLSAVRRLHPDALFAIFHTVVSDPDYSAPRFSINPGERIPAVTISQVCSRWREIAMSSPRLWSYINIVLPPLPSHPVGPHGNVEKYQALLASWRRSVEATCTRLGFLVERSRGCPLHVSYSASDPRDGSSMIAEGDEIRREFMHGASQPLLKIIETGCKEWASLSLYLKMAEGISSLVSVLVAFSRIKQEALRCLTIEAAYASHGVGLEEIWQALGQGLDLRKAPITSFTARFPLADSSKFRMRWDLLTTLSTGAADLGRGFGPQDAINVLRATPNIVQCTIQFIDGHGQTPFLGQQQALFLPKLEDLTLHGTPARVEFTALLDTPSLTRISAIYYQCSAQDEDHSAIAELVRRYGSQLLDVSLTYSSLTQSALGFVLEQLVEVESLHLHGKEATPLPIRVKWHRVDPAVEARPLATRLDVTLLQRLTPRWGDPSESTEIPIPCCICPKLQTLDCMLGDEPDEHMEEMKKAFIRLVEARRKAASAKQGQVGPLRRVSATFWVGPVKQMLEDLESRGVDTAGVSFKARYSTPDIMPRVYDLPIPGVGTMSVSMDCNCGPEGCPSPSL